MQFISFDAIRKRDWLYLVPFLLVALVYSAVCTAGIALYDRLKRNAT